MKKKVMNFMFFVLVLASFTSCTEVDPDETSQSNPHKQTTIRKKQLTKRLGCNGETLSNKVETINSLSKTYKIDPEKGSDLWNFTVNGVQSGDTAGGLWGRQGKFTVDLAPTLFNIQVYPGLNELTYRFAYCYERVTDPVTDNTQCAHTPEWTDEKSFWLEVEYKVVVLEGTRTISPSEDECLSEQP